MGAFRLITFNGIYLKDYMKIKTIDRGGILPPRKIETLEVKNKPGLIKASAKWDARIIKVGVQIIGENTATETRLEEVRDRVELIGSILNTDDVAPIVFDDEPDRTYYGMLIGESSLNEKDAIAETEIQFICFDPAKYGPEETLAFDVNGSLQFQNGTNADIYPKYTLTVKEKTTLLSIVGADDQVILGEPVAVDQSPVDQYERVLYEYFNTLTGWSSSQTVQDGFTQMGSMYVPDGKNFKVQSFGGTVDPATVGWRGPALVKDLGTEVQDFTFEMFLQARVKSGTATQQANQMGRVTVWFLDINNQVIAKMHVGDFHKDYQRVYGIGYMGGEGTGQHTLYYTNPAYNDFNGLMWIQRLGNKWWFQIGRWDYQNRRRYYRQTYEFIDHQNKWSQKVAKIQVAMLQYQNYDWLDMLLDTSRFWRRNDNYVPNIPYIADVEDIIDIDTSTGLIKKNGEPWMTELDPVSNFFPMKPGTNNLEFYPKGVADVDVTYKKRWY
jgi:predicted phage tail component-like protein